MANYRRCGFDTALHMLGLMLFLLSAATALAASEPLQPTFVDDGEPEELVDDPSAFEELVLQLPSGTLRQREALISELAIYDDDRLIGILTALEAGNLYADRATPQTVAISAGGYTNALTGEPVEDAAVAADMRRIPIDNRIRTQLRSLLARLNLNHDDAGVRFNAVRRAIRDGVNADNAALLMARQEVETSARVNGVIDTALALYGLQSPDAEVRLESVQTLRGALEPEVRNALTRIVNTDPEEELRVAAREALDSIQSSIRFYRFVENLFFGLSLGSILLLAAIGLAITFGVMGVINMAHGELIMIGAYTTWLVQQWFPDLIQWSLLIAIPSAFVVSGLVGIAIERGVIRFLYGRPLETLLATFGISLFLQQGVRSLFSPLNRQVISPDWISGSWVINPVLSLTYTRLYVLLFGLAVFFLLMLVIKRTRLGLNVRAVSQNRAMARAVGVRSSWVDALTFGLGAGVAGVAGVALSQITNVGPNLGQSYIIDSFMVVVFGGVGNLWGTLVSAMSLGLINNFLEPYAGAMLAKVIVLILVILFIQRYPRGLFPQRGRAAEA